jgi:hypothetical protein
MRAVRMVATARRSAGLGAEPCSRLRARRHRPKEAASCTTARGVALALHYRSLWPKMERCRIAHETPHTNKVCIGERLRILVIVEVVPPEDRHALLEKAQLQCGDASFA